MADTGADTWRAHLGQLSWYLREFRKPSRWWWMHRAKRGLHLPPLPRHRRRPGEVWAVSMVRNEVDIVGEVVAHLLRQGVDHVLIADHDSTDGTRELLESLAAREPRVHVVHDREPTFFQSEKITYLARRAWRAGADWVIPFDGDEYWFAGGQLVADHLRGQRADVVFADFHHMVKTSAEDTGPDTSYLLDPVPAFPSKVAFRAHPLAVVIPGNHDVARVGARARGLYVAHAQYRDREHVARKLRQGMAAAGKTLDPLMGEHWRDGARLDDSTIAEVWDSISHGRPDVRIHFAAAGPMVAVRPGTWGTWDPEHEVGP